MKNLLVVLLLAISLCSCSSVNHFNDSLKSGPIDDDNHLVRTIADTIVQDYDNLIGVEKRIVYENGTVIVSFRIDDFIYTLTLNIEPANFVINIISLEDDVYIYSSYSSIHFSRGVIPFPINSDYCSVRKKDSFIFFNWNDPESTMLSSEADIIGNHHLSLIIEFLSL